jgi:hypothetical protein
MTMQSATFLRAGPTTIAPLTNADIDDCARLLMLADQRKHARWTRPEAARYVAEALTRADVCAYVWRDARCAPVAFVIGRWVGSGLCISELCAPADSARGGDGLQLLQQMQREAGAEHVELDGSRGSARAARLLRSL